jgi:hypothetical protein
MFAFVLPAVISFCARPARTTHKKVGLPDACAPTQAGSSGFQVCFLVGCCPSSAGLVTLHALVIKRNCDADLLAVIEKFAPILKLPLDERPVDIQFWKPLRLSQVPALPSSARSYLTQRSLTELDTTFDASRNKSTAKMTANADRFTSATARLTYVAGRLAGKAYELILPKTQYGVPQFVDYPDLLKYLEEAFGDPDRVQNSRNKLERGYSYIVKRMVYIALVTKQPAWHHRRRGTIAT